ncbi:N-acetyltransferase family protein [Flavitalea antarctica]
MITIRLASDEDLPAILEIYNDVIIHTTAVFQYTIHTPAMRKEWFETKKEQGFPVFVALEDDVIAGFSTIGWFRAWQAYKYSVENSVYVDSRFRGRGIGKKLLQPLIESARTMNMHTIVAGIEAANIESIKLHEQFGFREVAHFREVGFKFGRWLDLKFLQLLLDTPADPKDG